jgi:glycosyltransferase involved in cell wall biosynthesis
MRILLVSNLYPPHVIGGAEVVAHRQAQGLAARGHEVSVFAGAWGAGAPRAGTLECDRVDSLRIYRMGLDPPDPISRFLNGHATARLAAILRTERPEVVHLHNVIGLGVDCISTAGRLGARVVVTLHDPWGICFRQTLTRQDGSLCQNTEECALCCAGVRVSSNVVVPQRVRRDTVSALLAQADWLLVPGAALAARYAAGGLFGRRLRVLSNGIDLQAFPPRSQHPSERSDFVTVGYLGEHKGLPDLIEAASLLARRQDLTGRWSLTIVGEGHLRDWATREIVDRKLASMVRLVGRLPRTDVVDLISRAAAVVLPSRWPENEPVVLLEAIAAGTAQIATAVGGNGALVEDGQSGLLVPRADPAALCQALARLIDEPGLAAAFGRRNLERRSAFDEEHVIDALLSLYAEVPPESPQPWPVVICAGPSPDALTMAALAHLHSGEQRRRLRFVWHGWANSRIWNSAIALWLWAPGAAAPIVGEALRRGLPLVLPLADEANHFLAKGFGAALLYNTPEQALGFLRALAEGGPLARRATVRTRRAALAWGMQASDSMFELDVRGVYARPDL